jgi:hypothetical protein
MISDTKTCGEARRRALLLGCGIGAIVIAAFALGCQGSSEKRPAGDPDGGSDDAGTDAGGPDAGTDSGVSYGPCEDSGGELTALGCDFYAVDLEANSGGEDAGNIFSVVVSNPDDEEAAHVAVWNGLGEQVYTTTLEPRVLQVIDLACDGGLCLEEPQSIMWQGLKRDSAFRITSDRRIVVYQWKPYGAQAFSTDASLLLPAPRLTGNYIAATWAKGWGWSQITIAATEDDTQVDIIPSADVVEFGGLGPYPAGVPMPTIALDRFDVLTLSSNSTTGLTGSDISADRPIAVFGANSCGNAPAEPTPETSWDSCCCDHLEEQLLPYESWGTSTVLARTSPREGCSLEQDPVVWQVVAGADDMTVSFDPPAPDPVGASHHFDFKGEELEFLSAQDHSAAATLNSPPDLAHSEAPFLAFQLMTSARQTTDDCAVDPENDAIGWGDPSLLLSPPLGQYLSEYVFTTDNVYDYEWDEVIIVREAGTKVELDCVGEIPDSAFQQVGASDWQVARVPIDDPVIQTGCEDGVHVLVADAPVGLSVFGVSAWQSYAYLAGVGVEEINPIIE